VSSEGGTGPVRAQNGRELFYLRDDQMMMAIPVLTGPTLRLGEPKALFRLPDHLLQLDARYYSAWDVAPDGRVIMVRAAGADPSTATPVVVVENWFEEIQRKAPG
jgi:hypothetical protein